MRIVIFATVLLSLLLTDTAKAQQNFWTGSNVYITDSTKNKIDNLFKKWDSPNSPGGAVGIIRNDSLLYAKGYGMANLEQHICMTPQSIFYMCSLSKQFTGYAITLLVSKGKVKLDDDIHVYLPWMPDFGKKVTVSHLLHHTSGIRDDIDLAAIAGLSLDGILTQTGALQLLKRQHALNFEPGEKFSYSNSNYVLLSEIIKKVSGQTYRSFMDSAIFKPLGMVNSRFVDDYQEIIANRVPSYYSTDGKVYKNTYQNIYTLGDGGLFTNIEDMARWAVNFYDTKVGLSKDIEQTTQKGLLNNGKEITYACGIVVDSSRGWKRLSHNGGLAGYNTVITVYPDLKMAFLVFGNGGDGSAYGKPNELAELFIPDVTQKTPGSSNAIVRDSADAYLSDPDNYRILTGDYIEENGYHFSCSLIHNKLWIDGRLLLAHDSGYHFTLVNYSPAKYDFHITKSGQYLDLSSPEFDNPLHMVKADRDTTSSDAILSQYVGNYYCSELDCNHQMILKNHKLYFTNNNRPDANIDLYGKDYIQSDGDMANIVMLRNKNGTIIGFELNDGAILHLRFNKTN
jgi:CubicO group peptidase (beta-lactamase class C family)